MDSYNSTTQQVQNLDQLFTNANNSTITYSNSTGATWVASNGIPVWTPSPNPYIYTPPVTERQAQPKLFDLIRVVKDVDDNPSMVDSDSPDLSN